MIWYALICLTVTLAVWFMADPAFALMVAVCALAVWCAEP